MKQKAPAILSFIGTFMFLGMWYIYLFVAQPEGQVFSEATEQLKYSFNPGAEHFNFFIFNPLFYLFSNVLVVQIPKNCNDFGWCKYYYIACVFLMVNGIDSCYATTIR